MFEKKTLLSFYSLSDGELKDINDKLAMIGDMQTLKAELERLKSELATERKAHAETKKQLEKCRDEIDRFGEFDWFEDTENQFGSETSDSSDSIDDDSMTKEDLYTRKLIVSFILLCLAIIIGWIYF